MAELLLLGMTHYPPLAAVDGDMAGLMRMMLADPGIPAAAKDPASWSAEARAEWGDDEGRSSAATHRAVLCAGFSRLRAELDAFCPDALLVWGDDQYENFREDVVPPYALLAYDDVETEPWAHFAWNNVWGEAKDHAHKVQRHPDIARWLAERLLEDDIDVAYAYRPLHHGGLAHAFMNTQLYLDYDRVGFPWPMVCMPINCYGRRVIRRTRLLSSLRTAARARPAVAHTAATDDRRRRRRPPPRRQPVADRRRGLVVVVARVPGATRRTD